MFGQCEVICDWFGCIVLDMCLFVFVQYGVMIELMIDCCIQQFVFSQFKVVVIENNVVVGSVVVFDVQNGEIFVFVNYLIFDLNDCVCFIGQ